jgi:mono/diheme cytochrome c family protein
MTSRLRTGWRALAAVAALGGAQAMAQEVGDVARGRQVAVRECGECHGVAPGLASANVNAPNFTRVADTPGMTAIALAAFFQTAHRTMPSITLPADDTRDVIAYILSLKVQ